MRIKFIITSLLCMVILASFASCDSEDPEVADNKIELDTMPLIEPTPGLLYWSMDSLGNMRINNKAPHVSDDLDSIVLELNKYFERLYTNPGITIEEPLDDKLIIRLSHEEAFLDILPASKIDDFLGTVTYMLTESEYISRIIIVSEVSLIDKEFEREDFVKQSI